MICGEKNIFVTKCVGNKYKLEDCSCTYDAYVKLTQPYARLLKSSVHDTPSVYWREVATVVTKKLADFVGEGEDVLGSLKGNPPYGSLGAVLDIMRRVLKQGKKQAKSHSYLRAAVMAASTVPLLWELVQAKYVVDSHCGGFVQDVVRWPQRMWEGASGATSWTWDAIASVPGKVGFEGRGSK